MTDISHLNALQARISNERGYLAAAKTGGERKLRGVWISQVEKEIANEMDFLSARGVSVDCDLPEMTDDELLAELGL